MSDRLQDLQRQRALVQEHLAWLDREIAAARDAAGPTAVSTATTSTTPANSPIKSASPAAVTGDAAAERAAEKLIAEYQTEVQALPANVRRGCFLYFALALALLALGVFAFYLLKTRG